MTDITTSMWVDAYCAGWDSGIASRPTDAELQAWAAEIRETAYRAGYTDGLAVDQHRQAAKVLTGAASVALDRARPGSPYIPRRRTAVA